MGCRVARSVPIASFQPVSASVEERCCIGSHDSFFCFGYVDETRHIAIAWVANDAPPSWLQPALSRALIAIAEDRAPEPLEAPPAADPALDPSGSYRVSGVGEVAVRRAGQQLRVGLRGVEYQGFPVAHGVHYVPGLDAYLRFASAPQGQITLSWDSVFVAVPSSARNGSNADR